MRDAPSIGGMRRRMSVQYKTTVSDGAGGQAVTWVTLGSIWADITPKKGEQKPIAGKLTAVVTHEIVTRYRTDLDISMRIVYGSRVFQIHGIIILEEKQRFLVLSCQEGVGS